ncbi:VPLPA-CTERM sorting domain-containing protein [Pacificoceanicola onchidii]|uniref:VPLPA-CTERM sorting domain-containing protein n=1 Tax=Pacificoceanicola onchidii TaxID=2562685 RepID=UPI001F118927|nr:VPLPA-CTERM sorting domain-containing protein [Pacificoceanicola onchidii]
MPRILPALAAILTFPVATEAAIFSPDGATASSAFNASYDAGNTIDGSGLPIGFGPGDIHATYAANNHWTTAASTNPLDQWIEWSFSGGASIGGLYIWNHLSNDIASNPDYEPTLFSLTFLDGVGGTLASFSGVNLLPQPSSGPVGLSQAFSLDAVLTGVFAVRFDVDGKEGALTGSQAYTGLAEVLFTDGTLSGATQLAPVPLPASGLLLLAALGGARLARRRKS